ncbi:glycoside hydrolase domain-containing protein [Sphingobacterium wenxiniae]|uniref:Putative alpha-1,2-mannosidase n=1 Tax=Sphingobacterium wenxiniae TaxID=683125 RepID=A0A1I6TUW7_9SPHI|nr:glycoside hydrolase domain-containing protein [Sphingobacterium wenxiniae]SFS92964.1 Putative alpha-1,2-mannosidase [Sphingobacterium wenxiniae]
MYKFLFVLFVSFGFSHVCAQSQDQASLVNVFLGSSGDHGQLSPAASYPFSALSIGAQTYPTTHTGYEYLAKRFYGFTHNRFEGVGCQGSGGLLFVKPLRSLDEGDLHNPLEKVYDTGRPGSYQVKFTNGLHASMAVLGNAGMHHYQFGDAAQQRGLYVDLSHSFNRAFVSETHKVDGQWLIGTLRSKTTCHVGIYTFYYALYVDKPVDWEQLEDAKLKAKTKTKASDFNVYIGFSAVSEEDARQNVRRESFQEMAETSFRDWNQLLGRVEVKGEKGREALFYSLLYRVLQSPYKISSASGSYRAIDGGLQQTVIDRYNGWAIWDNYKTQLPFLSVLYPELYQPIVSSIANLYPYGKKDFATQNEPSNTVRTEHAIVVLLDAYRKGYDVDFPSIIDSLKIEVDRLEDVTPDKSLETAYDRWALGHIYGIMGNSHKRKYYLDKSIAYRQRWVEEFSDLSRSDVDRMSARKMYQGTIRQYRWSVPFDLKGLKELMGGDRPYLDGLDDFFDHDYFNRANEPDLHVPAMYQASQQPWKAQFWMHQMALDTVINHYFNDNSKGIGAEIDRIFKNQPKAFIRTMDDDAGAMSAWFVWASLGLYPAAVGHPVYYIHLPIFEQTALHINEKTAFSIKVENYGSDKRYIDKVFLNGRPLDRNWLTHEEIVLGGELTVYASSIPNVDFGVQNQWQSQLDQ